MKSKRKIMNYRTKEFLKYMLNKTGLYAYLKDRPNLFVKFSCSESGFTNSLLIKNVFINRIKARLTKHILVKKSSSIALFIPYASNPFKNFKNFYDLFCEMKMFLVFSVLEYRFEKGRSGTMVTQYVLENSSYSRLDLGEKEKVRYDAGEFIFLLQKQLLEAENEL
jgi:hypothetical protein